jgi:hypothetical protein
MVVKADVLRVTQKSCRSLGLFWLVPDALLLGSGFHWPAEATPCVHARIHAELGKP